MHEKTTINEALIRFANDVTEKMTQLILGEPEEQLRTPFENFMNNAGRAFGVSVVCTGETRLEESLGRADYAIQRNKLLAGYVELKAPGIGANPNHFTGHNREQWKRFKSIPNLIYSDGNEWALYRTGKLIGKIIHLSGDITHDGKKAINVENADNIERLLRNFFSWEPFIPTDRKGKIDLKRFAKLLAPLCRMLRDNVTDALKNSNSQLNFIAKDWRELLFPDADDKRFADAYAQTVTFALLLGRSEGADPLSLDNAEKALSSQHTLLSRALQVLTDKTVRNDISVPLDMLIRVISAIQPIQLSGPENPWLYFYEDFLAEYDPNLRKDSGAYFTPIEVVHAQIRLIDELLVNNFNKPQGFANSDVITLDPAVGTGTYLLGIIEHTLNKIESEEGIGAVPGHASTLANNLYAFELLVGPYAVAELRISRDLRDRGAQIPVKGCHIYLTDTLESPYAKPPQLPLFFQPISDQHDQALEVKNNVPVIVCLGNPPYDRHKAATQGSESPIGGWVRYGDKGEKLPPILNDFIQPAKNAGYGGDIKNLYNLYVYFWRWALWKVFEYKKLSGVGIVSFISASSYLDGDAFCGMREHMRRLCDEIWIIDLGGEGRAARKEPNVFTIQTPVAIAIVSGAKELNIEKPANVHYTRISGTRSDKLKTLDSIQCFASLKWEDCSLNWKAPFKPSGKGLYFDWPLLTVLTPWQHSGSQFKRTWPISFDPEVLIIRWNTLLNAQDKAGAFKETRDRKINAIYSEIEEDKKYRKTIEQLTCDDSLPILVRYSYRSFDRQWAIKDNRIGDFIRPILWHSYSKKQLFITSRLTQIIGKGPTAVACHYIPDLHHFASGGGKDIIPLYCNSDATELNILPGLLDLLSNTFKYEVSGLDFFSYIYGILAHPAFTKLYEKELETRELHVPITKDASLFKKLCNIGEYLLWLHTYGECYINENRNQTKIPHGKAMCKKAISYSKESYPESFSYDNATKTLYVGEGQFAPVNEEVFNFEVSGLKVVHSWLSYRMKKGAGKKTSPLDYIRPECWTPQFTTELLELLWALEATIAIYPEQALLLEKVTKSACFLANELLSLPTNMYKPLIDENNNIFS